jgi:Holliday junction resolvasome RuvABC DNA-binding subunit
MAIKGKNQGESVSVWDPDRRAFREIALEDIKKQLETFGLADKEAGTKVETLARTHLEGLGFTAEEIEARVKKLKKEA